jgi:hypothetical protein
VFESSVEGFGEAVAGDWYRTNIPVAEERYEQWLAGDRAEEV